MRLWQKSKMPLLVGAPAVVAVAEAAAAAALQAVLGRLNTGVQFKKRLLLHHLVLCEEEPQSQF